MKITVLGSGSAYGMPTMFNMWGNADASNPQNRRTRASVLLEDEGRSILIDAGPEVRLQINGNNVSNLDAVFITHSHYDHIGGIPELPRAAKNLCHPIEIFAAADTMQELRRCYNFLFEDGKDVEPEKQNLRWSVLPNSGKFSAVGLEFETLLFPHHHIFSSAFRYQNFAYVTDWQEFPEGCDEFLCDLELLIVECNNGVDTETQNGHANIAKILQIKEKFQPRHIVLTHLSTRADDVALRQVLPDNCTLAYDGMIWQL
ncbi:MAG: MBL fold metallo-hydrolase [Alphaproteobacteria bacterium]|nr:MBL fold metallo-hydrolase [Alphaproteobacteria bacterium]